MCNVNRKLYLTVNNRGYMVLRMSYGERLRKARELAGLSQADLAQACGLSQPTIQHLEDPKKNARGSAFTVQLARLCGVSADLLADETGDMIPVVYRTVDPKIIAVARVMEPLPEYVKSAAVEDVSKIAQLVAQARADGTNG